MSFEELNLSASILRDLYKDNLVSVDTLTADQTAPSTSIKFLGNNLKEVIILVHKSNAIYLPDDELSLLTKMLAACNLTLADVAIVNLAKHEYSLSEIEQQLRPQKLIALGVDNAAGIIGIDSAPYVVSSHNNYVFSVAPDLKEMLGDSQNARGIKTKLWGALKQMFGL